MGPVVDHDQMPVAHVVPAGVAASAALADVVDRAKGGDALAPVTVVVPSNYVAVAARRDLVGRRGSLAAVTFVTPWRLAELVAAPRLAGQGRRPVSSPVLAAAVRRVLRTAPGVFGPVAGHPSTERALVRAYRELSDVPEDLRRAVASRSRRAADVVRIAADVRSLLSTRWYDEADLLAAATEAIEEVSGAAPVLEALGPVVVHQPDRIPAPVAAMLVALARRHHVTVVATSTGVAAADRTVRASLDRLGLGWSPAAAPHPGVHGVVSVSDPDEEVRFVVRDVVAAAREGVPGEVMGVVYGLDEPYRRLLHEQLRAAGVAFNGSSVRTVAEGLLGRTLLATLRLGEARWRREEVMAVLGSGLVVDADGVPVPSTAWERISRSAGVVGGRDWDERLSRHLEALDRRLGLLDPVDDEAAVRGIRREAAAARALRRTVGDLRRRLDPGTVPGTWSGLVAAARALVNDLFGGEATRGSWPDEDRAMAERVDAGLDRLEMLDVVDPGPTLEDFVRALAAELDAGLGRVGRLGEGVFVGPVTLAVGVPFRRIWVLGMSEGLFPGRPREDSVLPDAERAAADGHLPLARDRVGEDHRAWLSVLGAADHVVCTHPRGDLRRTADRRPSRWLLDAVSATVGERVSAVGLGALGPPLYRHVPSFVAGLRSADDPSSPHEYALCELVAADARGVDITGVGGFGSPSLRRSVELVGARSSRAFTRFDGNLAGAGVPSPLDPEVVVSPTRLEDWAACPHHYFLRHVLRVEPVEDPERELRISPLELGSLVHGVLDRWLGEVIDGPEGAPRPHEPWSPRRRARLHEILDEECDLAEARGVVGRSPFWEVDRRRLHREADVFLSQDDAARASAGAVPVRTELRFGFANGGVGPVTYRLPGGGSLRFRGSADRVDAVSDGFRVIDYKTGSSSSYARLTPDDPHAGGTRLQLPVYAMAVRAALGAPDAEVTAAYWFVTGRGGWAWRYVRLDATTEAAVGEALATIAEGIASGVFVARAEPPGYGSRTRCPSCSPDGLTTADRARELERKSADPALAPWLALAGLAPVSGSGR